MDLNITKILDDVRNKGYSTVESFFDKDTVKIILN